MGREDDDRHSTALGQESPLTVGPAHEAALFVHTLDGLCSRVIDRADFLKLHGVSVISIQITAHGVKIRVKSRPVLSSMPNGLHPLHYQTFRSILVPADNAPWP